MVCFVWFRSVILPITPSTPSSGCMRSEPASRSVSRAASKTLCQKAGQHFKGLAKGSTPTAAGGPVPTNVFMLAQRNPAYREEDSEDAK